MEEPRALVRIRETISALLESERASVTRFPKQEHEEAILSHLNAVLTGWCAFLEDGGIASAPALGSTSATSFIAGSNEVLRQLGLPCAVAPNDVLADVRDAAGWDD